MTEAEPASQRYDLLKLMSRKILKNRHVFKDVRVLTEFIWLRIEGSGGLL
jgi:hypothetical protein